MAIQHELDSPFASAVRCAESLSAFARSIGETQTRVFSRLKSEKPLWAEHVLRVEALYGISRHDLRPDIYGPPPALLDTPEQGRAR